MGHVKGGVLPAYCDPPNPCPKGYTAEDGCIEVEEFENRAEFSRKYQASQNCMCDSEHMFSCPDVNSFDSMYKNQQDPGLFGLDAIAPLEDIKKRPNQSTVISTTNINTTIEAGIINITIICGIRQKKCIYISNSLSFNVVCLMCTNNESVFL